MAYRGVIEWIWNRMTGHRDYRFFVVICHARTGSNLLYAYINAHPEVEMYGEIFKQLEGRGLHKMFQIFNGPRPRSIKVAGFKMFYTHPEDGDTETLLHLIESKTNPFIIHLTRRNRLRAYVSLKIAEQTNVWWLKTHQPVLEPTDKQVRIEPDAFAAFVREVEAHEQRIEERFGNQNYLAISYEELVDNPESCLKQLFDRMHVRPISPQAKYRKGNPESLEQLILNFDQIKDLPLFQLYISENL